MIGKMTETMFSLWLAADKLNCEYESERLKNKCKRLLYLDFLGKCDACKLSVVCNEVVAGGVVNTAPECATVGKIFWHLPAVRDEAGALAERFKGAGDLLAMEAMLAFRGFAMWLIDNWPNLSEASDFQTVTVFLTQQ